MRGLALMAPHFFTEDMGIEEIARAKVAFEQGSLRERMARSHADVDNAFYNWYGPWLLPEFRKWDITDALAYIRVPILIVQGEDDQYGTTRQIEVGAARNATARSRSRCCRALGMRPIAKRRTRRSVQLPISPTACCATTTKAICATSSLPDARRGIASWIPSRPE